MSMIVFSIVVHNEYYWEVDSYISLIASYNQFNKNKNDINIYIFDNTDNRKDITPPAQKNNIKIHYIALGENKGISKAYNYLAKIALKNGFEWIVFLDQDTHLPLDFYSKYIDKIEEKSSSFLLVIPIIKSNQQILSPCLYINYRSKKLNVVPNQINLKNHSAINTGLLVSCDFFLNYGGYNESLFVDFCDHDFFKKISKYVKKIDIINTTLIQDFSTDTNSLLKALFRYNIFLRDLKVYREDKSKIKILLFVDVPHLLRLTFKYKSLQFIKLKFGIK